MYNDKKWVIKETDEKAIEELYNELKINRTLCQLLVQRGVRTYDEARKFFRPSLEEHLYDPFLMKDMDIAVERLDRAMRNKEKILIYGDYDVDGTTAVALVYSFLKDFHYDLDYYIPDRYKEGYGVSMTGIDWAKQNGFSLIVSLDCGIKSRNQVAYAREHGIDFIICDHHLPDNDNLPPAFAILDPKREDCPYPYKELSGCGIGFKFMQAFALKYDIPFNRVANLLDLVAVSIAADIVPITDENRVLAFFGLKKINSSPRPGLRSLIQQSVRNPKVGITDIVFIIAPRINAAGRMDDARDAVRLLLSQEVGKAKEGADVLQEKNTERKQVDSDITEEAMRILDTDEQTKNRKTTVLYRPYWHKGVIGIVASRLLEKYYRPTVILTNSNEDDIITGSARSVARFDLYQALNACSDLLDQFGGHKYAAGLTLKRENLPLFIEKFEQVVNDTIEDDMLIPEIEIDAELDLRHISPKFYNILRQFAPFGPENMKPVFISRGLINTGWSAVVGNNHLKLSARSFNSSVLAKGIGYNLGHYLKQISNGQPFDVCFTLQENIYNENVALQLNLRDIKPSDRINNRNSYHTSSYISNTNTNTNNPPNPNEESAFLHKNV
ncbi:MAG: single-stranded-DNA-specific exonuclease RecJ [Sphingobacteriales bacterium]|jgi:single-stranded-DNA-specific exonuclease|nr:single-stranded-DNA-specific exonuclease RecJ [Sphingobacteriales bacterium]MBP9140523.1 single-stranded-DNA-specific exonuclease RecJ [Chitinophagales bacterium]MDA0197296.1 single-stranded-DNA-specific exonuclease RecJ [Bacteroidota bacterium]MBK6890407.1 single-stranded-DNA-specific exonuclease RecJ [Sphingobacteriales bacterium]MBK7526538.1 single-stranded-DNA-specific exonuclease RecJ [Sphingobacteriales bacterium]